MEGEVHGAVCRQHTKGVEPHWEGSFCLHPHPSDFQPVTGSCTSHITHAPSGEYIKNLLGGKGAKMPQWLRAQATLKEVPHSIPSSNLL